MYSLSTTVKTQCQWAYDDEDWMLTCKTVVQVSFTVIKSTHCGTETKNQFHKLTY